MKKNSYKQHITTSSNDEVIGGLNKESFEDYIIRTRREFIEGTTCHATPEQKCNVLDDKWCDDCQYRS